MRHIGRMPIFGSFFVARAIMNFCTCGACFEAYSGNVSPLPCGQSSSAGSSTGGNAVKSSQRPRLMASLPLIKPSALRSVLRDGCVQVGVDMCERGERPTHKSRSPCKPSTHSAELGIHVSSFTQKLCDPYPWRDALGRICK